MEKKKAIKEEKENTIKTYEQKEATMKNKITIKGKKHNKDYFYTKPSKY